MVENFAQILDDVCDPITVRKFMKMSSLSRNEAISMLEKYVKTKGEPVWALYEISGVVDSSEYSYLPAGNNMIKHVVVPESSLDETKSTFSEVLSTVLHSIQRTNPKDTRVYGRSWADNEDLKGRDLPQQQKSQNTVESSSVELKKEKSVEPEKKPSSSSSSKSAAEARKNTFAPLKKQANLSMFTKKTENKSEEKGMSVSPQPEEKKTRKRPKVEIDEPELEEVPSVVKKEEKTPEKTKKQKKILQSPESDGFPSSREQTPVKEESPPAKRKKSGVNDENKKVKKRLIVTDSDDEEAPVPMEVDEKKAEEKPKKTEDRRRTTRIEKVVETYVDEDGYLVSKEVQKTVECSPQKMSSEKPKPKVITAPAPGAAKIPKKNSTITSFFKKA